MTDRRSRLSLAVLLALALPWSACAPSTKEGEGEVEGEPALDPLVLETGSATFDTTVVAWELVQLTRADGEHTFVQWIPPIDATGVPASVVVQTQPYDGIVWSGDDVDAAFAAATPGADGAYADVACEDDNDRGVAYAPLAPEDGAESALLHLLNGHGVLLVYGRFYACDDVEGEIADMRAALSFLATRPAEIDAARVSLFGNSWGGFLALYGAAYAPDGVDVHTAVPINPPADLTTMLAHVDALADVYPDPDQLSFFDAYRYRIEHAAGGPPGEGDYTRYQLPALCDGIAGKDVLLLHDTWDTLVPFEGSVAMVETCGADGLWWYRPEPIDYEEVGLDHGLLGREPGYPSVYTFAHTYLYVRSNDAEHVALVVASRASLRAFLQLVHDEQLRGGEAEEARVRLLEATGPTVWFYVLEEGVSVVAADVLATEVNAVWGTTLDGAALRAQLALGLPAPRAGRASARGPGGPEKKDRARVDPAIRHSSPS